MIHYHGTPISGTHKDALLFLQGRHALVSFHHPQHLEPAAEVCQSFIFDNGAFSVWKSGKTLDREGYYKWVEDWSRHPGLDWALIPDVIDGTPEANDRMLEEWPAHLPGVPVWHLDEPVERCVRLCESYSVVALGSSGKWSKPGSKTWWLRMAEVLNAVCDDNGRPMSRLHGLRMLNPTVFTRIPLASADSSNAGVNAGSKTRFGSYVPTTAAQRATVIAERIEQHNSPAKWGEVFTLHASDTFENWEASIDAAH